MTIRELCEKEVVQLEQGVCLGRADDLAFDPATARLQSLILLGRPRLFGLLGREENLTIPFRRSRPSAPTQCWCIPSCPRLRPRSPGCGRACAQGWGSEQVLQKTGNFFVKQGWTFSEE